MINFLRWLAVLPISIISAIVIPIALRLLTNLGIFNYRGGEPLPFFIELGLSVAMGGIFILVGKQVAPSNKKIVGKVLFAIGVVILICLFIFNWQLGERMAAFYSLSSLVGAYLALEYD